jgi:hypothetical protein
MLYLCQVKVNRAPSPYCIASPTLQTKLILSSHHVFHPHDRVDCETTTYDCCPIDPPICLLTCSLAHRAVSIVRGENSRFWRVSLIICISQSAR